MIIQTGMRTDIPAFYSEWLVNRIKEKYVLVCWEWILVLMIPAAICVNIVMPIRMRNWLK